MYRSRVNSPWLSRGGSGPPPKSVGIDSRAAWLESAARAPADPSQVDGRSAEPDYAAPVSSDTGAPRPVPVWSCLDATGSISGKRPPEAFEDLLVGAEASG